MIAISNSLKVVAKVKGTRDFPSAVLCITKRVPLLVNRQCLIDPAWKLRGVVLLNTSHIVPLTKRRSSRGMSSMGRTVEFDKTTAAMIS